MPVRIEIKMDDADHSRIHLSLTQSGALSVQLLRPGSDRDGHGLFFVAGAFVEGKELQALLASLTPTEEDASA